MKRLLLLSVMLSMSILVFATPSVRPKEDLSTSVPILVSHESKALPKTFPLKPLPVKFDLRVDPFLDDWAAMDTAFMALLNAIYNGAPQNTVMALASTLWDKVDIINANYDLEEEQEKRPDWGAICHNIAYIGFAACSQICGHGSRSYTCFWGCYNDLKDNLKICGYIAQHY